MKVPQVWDILQPIADGKWWAYAALAEVINDFERIARQIAKTIISEACVHEQNRILKKQPDGKYLSHHIEIVVIPESDEEGWKGLSDELATIRAVWRCRCYYFVPPVMCIVDACGLRIGFRALPPEGARVIYGPGAANLQRQSAEQLQHAIHCLAQNLNLKRHKAFPFSHTPGKRVSVGSENISDRQGASNENQSKCIARGSFLFNAKDDSFETIFGHEVVICTTAGGVRFMEIVAGLFPVEVGPDMERIAREAAERKKKRDAEAKNKASQELATAQEKEAALAREKVGEKTVYERFRETARELLGLTDTVDYKNFSLHQLQFKARELGIQWTGTRFDLIPRIEDEEKRLAQIKKEQDLLENQILGRKKKGEDQRRKERERLEGINASKPGFGLVGIRRPLRPEFVRKYALPLNSDAACSWDVAIPMHRQDRIAVEEATEHYYSVTIPSLAVLLQKVESIDLALLRDFMRLHHLLLRLVSIPP